MMFNLSCCRVESAFKKAKYSSILKYSRYRNALTFKSRSSSKQGVRTFKPTDTIYDAICRVYGDDGLISKYMHWG